MDGAYWNRVAGDYDGEIFSSFESDRTGILRRRLDEFADCAVAAADVGCGVGKYLPALVERFARVDAYDLSPELLRVARRVARRVVAAGAPVRFFQRDFAARSARVNRVRFVLCANVLIVANAEIREAILRAIVRMLEPGGRALFVVPSLESALLAASRLTEWYRRDGLDDDEAFRLARSPAATSGRDLARGYVRIDGVPTKHFLREEFALALSASGLEAERFDKVEYGWDTEFEAPPDWMGAPYPWDWLVTARRTGPFRK